MPDNDSFDFARLDEVVRETRWIHTNVSSLDLAHKRKDQLRDEGIRVEMLTIDDRLPDHMIVETPDSAVLTPEEIAEAHRQHDIFYVGAGIEGALGEPSYDDRTLTLQEEMIIQIADVLIQNTALTAMVFKAVGLTL